MVVRVAILCSGLGRINRGNETWALRLAEDLPALGFETTLYAGAELPSRVPVRVLTNLPREAPVLRSLLSWDRRYLLEQLTFAAAFRRSWKGEHDVVHTADPNLAQQLLAHARKQGYQLIYKDGLAIGAEWCSKFPWVQVLAPFYKELAAQAGKDVSRWHVIPHYVPPPALRGGRMQIRSDYFGVRAEPCTVVLGVGDFSPVSRKRLDWIVHEVSQVEAPVFVVLAGQATEADCRRLRRLAEARIPGRYCLLPNVPREHMGDIYEGSDLLVHAALREPFGLVLIEAMAYGLPVVVHQFPVSQWIVGQAGMAIDMTRPGELARALRSLIPKLDALRPLARQRAQQTFSREAVLPLYQTLYHRAVLG